MAIANSGAGKLRQTGFPFDIDVRAFQVNSDLLSTQILRMARNLGNLKEPMTFAVKNIIIPSMQRNFFVGGRPKWAPLSPERLAYKLNIDPMDRYTLVWTQLLFKRATSFAIWRITDTQADMEALDRSVEYARFHQTGTFKMPQRQFAILQLKDIENIVIIFDMWIRLHLGQSDYWPYSHKEY